MEDSSLTRDPVPFGHDPDAFPKAPEGQRPRGEGRSPQVGSEIAQRAAEEAALPSEAVIPWSIEITQGGEVKYEVIQLDDPAAVADALDRARTYKREVIDPLIKGLERVVAMMVRTVGSATIRAGEYEISAPAKRSYTRDLHAIKIGLLEAGCPAERVSEVIVETVSLSATTGDLDRLAKANPDYKRVIDEHTQVEEKARTATVKRSKDAGA